MLPKFIFHKKLATKLINNNKITRKFHLSIPKASNYHPLGSHRDTPDNMDETYFDFTEDNYKRVIMNIFLFIISCYI